MRKRSASASILKGQPLARPSGICGSQQGLVLASESSSKWDSYGRPVGVQLWRVAAAQPLTYVTFWDRPDLPPRRPAPRRPRPPLPPSFAVPAGAAPESGAPCPGPGSLAVRRPASPPSEPPARGPAGRGVSGQAGRGWTGRGSGRGREGGSAGGAGALPSCSLALHIWFRFLSPGEVKVEGRAQSGVS